MCFENVNFIQTKNSNTVLQYYTLRSFEENIITETTLKAALTTEMKLK